MVNLAKPSEWIADAILAAQDRLAARHLTPPPANGPQPTEGPPAMADTPDNSDTATGTPPRWEDMPEAWKAYHNLSIGHQPATRPLMASVMPGGTVTPAPAPAKATTPARPPLVPGILIFKCSHCDNKFTAYPVADSVGMLNGLIRVTNGAQFIPAAGMPFSREHACPDGSRGIGYCVGVGPVVPVVGGWRPLIN